MLKELKEQLNKWVEKHNTVFEEKEIVVIHMLWHFNVHKKRDETRQLASWFIEN